LKDPGSIRKWARRVFSRTQFSERVNIISQKYLLIVQQLERSGSQKQLVFQNTNFSPQLAASQAKKNNYALYIGSAN